VILVRRHQDDHFQERNRCFQLVKEDIAWSLSILFSLKNLTNIRKKTKKTNYCENVSKNGLQKKIVLSVNPSICTAQDHFVLLSVMTVNKEFTRP
jgi:hypothetical protein